MITNQQKKNVDYGSKKDLTERKKNNFPHAFDSKDPNSTKNKIAAQMKQFLEQEKRRKIEEYEIRNYENDKLVKRSKNTLNLRTNKENIPFANEKLRSPPKSYHKCSQSKIAGQLQKCDKVVNKSLNKALEHHANVRTIPSIPSKKSQFGYVVDEKNSTLSYPTLVAEMKYTGEKENMPGPSDYKNDIKKRVKGVTKIKEESHKFRPSQIQRINQE